MTMGERKIIEWEQGWDYIQKGITKLKHILEGVPEQFFTSEDYINLYTTIYNMCTQRDPKNYSSQLYDRYRETFEEYYNSKVLPALREKHGELMLRELVKQWDNLKIMIHWLSRFFNYLERDFIRKQGLTPLNEVGLLCFHGMVYQEMKTNVRDAVLALIEGEREGEQIDRALLKNVLGIFVAIGMGNMDYYENDFEATMLEETAAYYSRKSTSWILEDSCPDYTQKEEECLKQEKERVGHYLHADSEKKLLEKVHELFSQHESQLLEKEHSGCCSLLRDDKHVTDEGTMLVKQAEDAANNKRAEKKDIVGAQEQMF